MLSNDPLVTLYPISIHQARYGGVYEGGEWFALAYNQTLHPHATGGDSEAAQYWKSPEVERIGRGDTPNEAVADLIRRNLDMGAVHDFIDHVTALEEIVDSLRETPSYNTVDDLLAMFAESEDDDEDEDDDWEDEE